MVEVNNQAEEENVRMVEVNGQMEENVAERVRRSRSLTEVNKQSQSTSLRREDADVDGRGDEL